MRKSGAGLVVAAMQPKHGGQVHAASFEHEPAQLDAVPVDVHGRVVVVGLGAREHEAAGMGSSSRREA